MFENSIIALSTKPESLQSKELGSLTEVNPFKLPDIKDLPKTSEEVAKFDMPNIAQLPPLNTLDIAHLDERHTGFLPTTGEWSGERGNSKWTPNSEIVPDPEDKKGGNPNGLAWGEILDKHDIDGVEYKDGYPDFSSVSVGEVTIESFTDNRDKNFRQADEKLAKQWTDKGRDDKEWTARDIKEWRQENGCTWHEHQDCQTMQLVPKEIHNNTPHAGGISEIKKQQANN